MVSVLLPCRCFHKREGCGEPDLTMTFTAESAGSFWPDALGSMREGGVSEFYVPYKLAYGSIDDPSKRPALVRAETVGGGGRPRKFTPSGPKRSLDVLV